MPCSYMDYHLMERLIIQSNKEEEWYIYIWFYIKDKQLLLIFKGWDMAPLCNYRILEKFE